MWLDKKDKIKIIVFAKNIFTICYMCTLKSHVVLKDCFGCIIKKQISFNSKRPGLMIFMQVLLYSGEKNAFNPLTCKNFG